MPKDVMQGGGLNHITQQPIECLKGDTKKKKNTILLILLILDWKLHLFTKYTNIIDKLTAFSLLFAYSPELLLHK